MVTEGADRSGHNRWRSVSVTADSPGYVLRRSLNRELEADKRLLHKRIRLIAEICSD